MMSSIQKKNSLSIRSHFKEIQISRVPFYNDEPKIYQYVTNLVGKSNGNIFSGYGTHLKKKSAIKKSFYEAIERYSSSIISPNQISSLSRTDLKDNHIDPGLFISFTDEQLKDNEFEKMYFSDSTKFECLKVINAIDKSEILLPAQFILFPYDSDNEPIIRFPSTNGIACSRSLLEAQCKGILELFERDAFMCWYLTNTEANLIDFDNLKNPRLKTLGAIFNRYRLNLKILILPSKQPFPVICAILIDETGIGPGLCVGLKCHPNIYKAIEGAVYEAQQMRPWLRDHIEINGLPVDPKKNHITDFWERALYWSHHKKYREIESLWQSADKLSAGEIEIKYEKYIDLDWGEINDILMIFIKDWRYDLFFYEFNNEVIDRLKVRVVKAIIPQAQPIFLNERYPYLLSDSLAVSLKENGPRWNVGDLESEFDSVPPHPFT